MKLLTNNNIARWIKTDANGYMQTAFIATASVHGPFKRKLKITMDDVLSYVLGSAIGFAIVAVFFDVIVWRP